MGAGGQKGRQRDQPARDRVGQVAQDPFDEARVVALPAAGKDRERADDQRDRIGDRVDPAADVGPQERDGSQRRKTVGDPAARAAAPPVRQQREREKDRHQRQVIGHAAQRMFPVQRVNREKVQRQQHFGRGFPAVRVSRRVQSLIFGFLISVVLCGMSNGSAIFFRKLCQDVSSADLCRNRFRRPRNPLRPKSRSGRNALRRGFAKARSRRPVPA